MYAVGDGALVLVLEPALPGGFVVVTPPFVPGLVTEGETPGEAFADARDAIAAPRDAEVHPCRPS